MKKAGQPAEYMDGEAFAAYIAGRRLMLKRPFPQPELLKK